MNRLPMPTFLTRLRAYYVQWRQRFNPVRDGYKRAAALAALERSDPLDGNCVELLEAMASLSWTSIESQQAMSTVRTCLANIDQCVLALHSARQCIEHDTDQHFYEQLEWEPTSLRFVTLRRFFVTQQQHPIPVAVGFARLSQSLLKLLMELSSLSVTDERRFRYHEAHLARLLDYMQEVLRVLLYASDQHRGHAAQ